jgi:hypothetical protein
MLIADIRWIFDGQPEQGNEWETKTDALEKISSAGLAEQLSLIQGRPWAEWRGGKPISQNALARLLRPFNIKPGTVRFESETLKGYKRADFEDVFERYGAAPTVTPSQPNKSAHSDASQTVTPNFGVTLPDPQKPYTDVHCDDLTVDGRQEEEEESLWTL